MATSLNNLALLYYSQGQYAKAEPLYRAALAIREKTLGAGAPRRGHEPQQPGVALRRPRPIREGRAALSAGLAIREKALGPEHPDVATSLNNLAVLYHTKASTPRPSRSTSGRWRSGKRPWAGAPRRGHQPQQPGGALPSQGQYAKAEPLYERALAIWEKALGPEHPDVATSLNNLAVLYDDQGQYAKAEPLYQRALAIREKALGPEHPDVAPSLNNLASLYHDQGQYAKAEPLYQRALAIREKALGRSTPTWPRASTTWRRFTKPRPIREGRASLSAGAGIREKALGPEHPDVATSLNNLAWLYEHNGQYAKAEPLYRALAIEEKAWARSTRTWPRASTTCGFLYTNQGQCTKAEPLYRRALNILFQSTVSTGHRRPEVRRVIDNYVALLETIGRNPARIRAQLNDIGRPFGMNFGSGE